MASADSIRNKKAMQESYLLELLEPRIMLSADPFGAAEVAVDLLLAEEQDEVEYKVNTPVKTASTDLEPLDVASVTALFASQDLLPDNLSSSLQPEDGGFISSFENDNARVELIIIDAGVSNQQQLLQQIIPTDSYVNYQIHYLDQNSEGINQVSDLLNQYSQIDAVHLLSHGQSDGVQLGSSWIDADSLQQKAGQITQWSSVLTDEADILLYGCDVTSSEAGIEFVQTLQRLTGADIAASDDKTGAKALGGDWDLEYQSGAIEAQLAFSVDAQQNWQGVLGAITVTTDQDTLDGDADLTSLANLALTPGSDGLISLREAIIAANANADADTITLGAGTYTLTIAGSGTAVAGDLDIANDLSIIGAGASNTIIDGNGIDRIFQLKDAGTDFNLTSLTLQGGDAGSVKGGAIMIGHAGATVSLNQVVISGNTADWGAGVYNQGTLNVTDSVIEGNTATGTAAWGGGLMNEGSATLERVTFSGNTADYGGGIYSDGPGSTTSLVNVTVSGNSAIENLSSSDSAGGGLYAGRGTFNIVNSTITENVAPSAQGGGIGAENATINIQNTIISANTASFSNVDVDGTFVSLGNNLIGDTSGSLGWIGSDLTDVSAGLGALANNGGFSQTHALMDGSLAINAGNNLNAPIVDQRSINRIGTIDIGAYESENINLFLSTNGSANYDGGAVGNDNDIVAFDGPSLNLELGDGSSAVTDGTFSVEHSLPENVRAMHYVNSVVTVDTNTIAGGLGTYELQPGQIVLSMRAADKSDFTVPILGGGTLTVNNTDVLVYTPSTGTYEMLLEDAILKPDLSAANIHAITIVEQAITIGVDTTLAAGTYLIARSDPAVHSDISTYDNTNGRQDLLLGADFLSDTEHIQGLELLEAELVIGNTTLVQGTLLVTIDQDMTVGTTGGTTVGAQTTDVIALTVNATQQDSTPDTNVDAQIFLDGSDVSLNVAGSKEINGLTLVGNSLGTINSEPTLSTIATDPFFATGGSATSLFSGTIVDTIESGQTLSSLTLTVSNVSDGGNEILNIDGNQIALSNGTSGITTGNSLNFNVTVVGSTATVSLSGGALSTAQADSLIDAISYQHNSGSPTLGDRIVTITELVDSGGTLNGGDDTATLSAASTVSVTVQGNEEISSNGAGSAKATAMDASGNHVVVWSEQNTDSSGWGVYAQRFDSTGSAQGTEIQINQTTADDQRWASVGMSDSGKFVVTWNSSNQDGTASSIYARQFNVDGSAAGNEFRVNTQSTGAQSNASIDVDASGNFIIVWQGDGPADSNGVFFRRFDAAGTAVDASEVIAHTVTNGTVSEFDPVVAWQSNGKFVVAWEQDNNKVYFQRFDNAGAMLGGKTQIDSALSNSSGLSIDANSSGGFAFAYRDEVLGGAIFARAYNEDGSSAYSSGNTLTLWAKLADAQNATVAIDDSGEVLVAYQTTSAGGDIHLQRINADGSEQGSATALVTDASDQSMPALAMLDLSNYALAWNDVSSATVNTFAELNVNSAPVLADNTPALTTIDEDNFISIGDSVAAIVVDGSITDVDGSPVESIAITAVEDVNGTWQFSVNNGGTWSDVDDSLLAVDHALLLDGTLSGAATQKLRFVPDGDYNGSASFTFRAWDQTSGSVGNYADTTSNGSTTAFSGATDTASITINAVNDEPTLNTTGSSPVFREGGSAASLFTGSSVNTFEPGQLLIGMELTVSNVTDGTNEKLNLDGSAITLTHLTSGTTATSGLTYNVSVSSGTATVTIAGGTLTTAQTQTLVDAISYQNDSSTPTIANRLVSIISLQDNGGTANSGDDTATLSVSSTVTLQPANKLWLSTTDDVSSPSGALGLDSWTDSSVIGFDPAASGFEPTTSGTFNSIFDIASFTDNTNVDAIHYVTTDIGVGTDTPVNLIAGDVLFSLSSDETLVNSDLSTLDVKKEDVIIFRPDSAGVYNAGTFSLLFSNPNDKDISGITLVEEATLVGDTILQQGSFLFLQDGAGGQNDHSIHIFTPGDLSVLPTNGVVQLLIDGQQEITAGEGIFQDKPSGIELVENDYSVAGTTLNAGTILLTMEGDKGIYVDNTQAGNRQDIFALEITKTTLVNGITEATVSRFFDGSDVGLNNNDESLDALSFIEPQSGVNSLPTGSLVITGTVAEDQTLTADTSGVLDSDGLGVFSYQWQRDGATVSGATASTYILGDADVGTTISVSVSYTDGGGNQEVVTSADTTAVLNVNDDPTLNNAITDQNATEDSLFSYIFAAGSFGDVDVSDTLTYSATLSGGAALPSWLNFDDATRTFSGTPLNADVGTLTIEITADDSNGGTPATDQFDLVIANSNDDPTLNNAIIDQNATEDSAFSYTFAANSFGDVDAGDTLTYNATLSSGAALPTWLTFDDATRTFSGTPLNADVGTLTVDVIADDGNGGTPATDSFDLVIANSNDDPTLNNAITDQNATEDSLFSYTFAAGSFGDVDAGDTLTYSATLSGGTALPSWLNFDNATRTFSGTPLN
ncbi:DUF4347 domain-containing protein, partial [Neptunomonas japonica]|uniref:DUF4347 domain-containing protein n=1 Tax=Neptunomonas japonica TaxID=417574 RepID=UPI00048F3B50